MSVRGSRGQAKVAAARLRTQATPHRQGCCLQARPHLGGHHVLCVFLLARRRVEHDVVNGLYQFQLDHTLDEEAGKQFLIYIR